MHFRAYIALSLAALAVASGCTTTIIQRVPVSTATASVESSRAPLINALDFSPKSAIGKNDFVTFTVVATDPGKRPLQYNWTTTKGNLTATTGLTVAWQPLKADGTLETGLATVTVVVSNGDQVTTGSVNIQIQNDGQAVISEPPVTSHHVSPAPGDSQVPSLPKATVTPSVTPSPTPSARPSVSPTPTPHVSASSYWYPATFMAEHGQWLHVAPEGGNVGYKLSQSPRMSIDFSRTPGYWPWANPITITVRKKTDPAKGGVVGEIVTVKNFPATEIRKSIEVDFGVTHSDFGFEYQMKIEIVERNGVKSGDDQISPWFTL